MELDLELVLFKNGEESISIQLSGGLFQGYCNVLGLIDDVIVYFNLVVWCVMNDVNMLYVLGVDLNGDVGVEMFMMCGFEVMLQVVNCGLVFLEFNIIDYVKV